jgi:hypothetical protein
LNGIGPSIQFSLTDNLQFELMVGYGANCEIVENSFFVGYDYFTYTAGVSMLYRIYK